MPETPASPGAPTGGADTSPPGEIDGVVLSKLSDRDLEVVSRQLFDRLRSLKSTLQSAQGPAAATTRAQLERVAVYIGRVAVEQNQRLRGAGGGQAPADAAPDEA